MTTRITQEVRGHVLLIGLNRPEKRNAADFAMLSELASAFGRLDRDPEVRVAVVHAVGGHFTAGLDLEDLGPRIGSGSLDFVGEDGIDPWGVDGTQVRKPVVVAVQGLCLTLGIELILAADVTVAASDARFGQIEVTRGILPFGGATLRLPRAVGWGNAMRWMLTGDLFDAAEAFRLGLVQEVVTPETLLPRAVELAERIAEQAPLAVQAVLSSARTAVREGDPQAEAALQPELLRLATSEDARIGMEAFASRQKAHFVGR